ncbi:hypothetical protein F443_04122 [Phytophthora nicotianae P1569]|uniref:Uncharacterized protein n=1 Tax=Phytophthora nicotianae P1569 TaxID=1317065 RepID=V9FPA2_PHYNI|nr:hypothetical protein F443_04122 [Phytophthora nicotianae P1569]
MDTLMQVMRVRGSRMKSHVPLADYPIPEAHEPDDIYVLVVLTPPPKGKQAPLKNTAIAGRASPLQLLLSSSRRKNWLSFGALWTGL